MWEVAKSFSSFFVDFKKGSTFGKRALKACGEPLVRRIAIASQKHRKCIADLPQMFGESVPGPP